MSSRQPDGRAPQNYTVDPYLLMQLRFNKVAELIHNSTCHRNLERACVTVYFQEIIDKVGCLLPGACYMGQLRGKLFGFLQ